MYIRHLFRKYLILLLFLSINIVSFAQKKITKTIEGVTLEIAIKGETTSEIIKITNNKKYDIDIIIRKGNTSTRDMIIKGESKSYDNIPFELISYEALGEGKPLWNKKATRKEWEKLHPKEDIKKPAPQKEISGETVILAFMKWCEQDNYWSTSSIKETEAFINNHIDALSWAKDKNAYIGEKELDNYLKEQGKKLTDAQSGINNIAENFLASYQGIKSDFSCKDSIINILNERAERRENALIKLDKAINPDTVAQSPHYTKYLIYIGIVLLLIIVGVIAMRRKNKKHIKAAPQDIPTDEASPAIVVRRKTTSILKKQSLDDVIGNSAYMEIECSDFCSDSAVRKIHIKNSCIKEIYNMYAEDLRNPEHPKEDGCMVLGRWIYDESNDEYHVSLEEIVQPGDDAVFQEYELNFGGKIKLRVAERLRKLRRDTNLQYDLTCWVHSHPGLGIFFSNSDSSVQMQLKHPSHPNFLTAIVVDILTPQQEFGIFTFRHDSTINSKNDLKKMYSLEELHKWAIESDRNSFKSDDYYNILSKSESLYEECQGIELDNSAIIDICSITTESNTGLIGWVFGYKRINRGKKEFIVNTISRYDSSMDNEMIGCLVAGTHCSIPSIRKAITAYSEKVKFVLFYSIPQDTLTTIPMSEMQLNMDDKFYSEEKLEDLKIWTRRKR